ncbi:MAG: SDR family oxidoreductase [Rhodospirillaceae bacterium]|nr:SDR family oxidoreductase [Rhodospirillaceae bacterium]
MNTLRLALTIIAALTGASAAAETVLVTGANRGLGLEFTRQYAAKGWTVIATARDPAEAEDLNALAAGNAKIRVERLDVTDAGQIAALAAKYRGTAIDVLLNNAGVFGDRPGQTFGSFDEALLHDVISVNVYGPLKVSEGFAEHVAASGQKKIAVISSIVGSIGNVRGAPSAPYYAISKAAVNMAMRGLSKTLAPRGIAVGIYHPGGVDTRMLREAMGMTRAAAEESLEQGAAFPGSFKPLTPEDSVAQLIVRIDGLTMDTSGNFVAYDGQALPW